MTTPKEVPSDTDVAVRWILARYCQLVDDRDFDAAADLFTEDARFLLGDTHLEGRPAIRAWLDSVPEGMFHRVTNVVVSNGSHQGSTHALADLVVDARTDSGWATVMVGRYHDTLTGAGRAIRFTQRIVTTR